MARRHPARADHNPLRPVRLECIEKAAGRAWTVVRMGPDQARKLYRCPGCDHEIPPGTGHLVTWPADTTGGVHDRRHWHTQCWKRRPRR